MCPIQYFFRICAEAINKNNDGKYTYSVFDHFSGLRIVFNIQVLPNYKKDFMLSNKFSYGTISQ